MEIPFAILLRYLVVPEANSSSADVPLRAGADVSLDPINQSQSSLNMEAETAGDLLLYFGHPDVVFALIIRERHTRIR
jgi:hypothetical protein